MRAARSLFWIACLFTALFMGPFLFEKPADLSIKSRVIHDQDLRDAVGEEPAQATRREEPALTQGTSTFPPVPPFLFK